MTALAAVWSLLGVAATADDCRAVLAGQSQFGRASPTIWSEGLVALGRSDFHAGPPASDGVVSGGGGRFHLVADARLHDRKDLIRALGVCRSGPLDTDAQLIMALWERLGHTCVELLYGDFAIVMWDSAERKLFLARDATGQRPLHFHRSSGLVAVASMPSGLHALPAIPNNPDLASHASYLAMQQEPGRRSFYAGVDRVLPGEIVCMTGTRLSSVRYWRPNLDPLTYARRSDYVDQGRAELDRAVRNSLAEAGAPIACHLSAGLDSAAICATACRQLGGGGALLGFTAVPRDGSVSGEGLNDEGALAALTASQHNVEHVRVGIGPLALSDTLERDRRLFQRPAVNPFNSLWIGRINDLAEARGASLLLAGSFGNMTLSYDGRDRLAVLLQQRRLLLFARETLAYARHREGSLVRALSVPLGAFLPNRLLAKARGQPGGMEFLRQSTALSTSAMRSVQAQCAPDQRPFVASAEERLHRLSTVDPGNYNKGNLAGWGLETRDPFADRRLAEWCLRVPLALYFDKGVPRALARAVLTDRVPQPVLTETRKGVQSSDWAATLSRSLDGLSAAVEQIADCGPAAELLDIIKLRAWLSELRLPGEPTAGFAAGRGIARAVIAGEFIRSSA